MSNPSEDSEGSASSKISKFHESSSSLSSFHNPENKSISGLSNWLNSAKNKKSPSPPSSSNVTKAERTTEAVDLVSASGSDVVLDTARRDSGSTNSRDPDIEEEYQIQLALELSAKEDPEAVQIEAVKQISLGSCDPENSPAEIVAYRYWVSLPFQLLSRRLKSSPVAVNFTSYCNLFLKEDFHYCFVFKVN